MSESVFDFELPIWRATLGLLAGYAIVLLTIFLVFFVVPYMLFLAS